jgi:23S rRNA (cytidine1920-2'-O)/16S rRNA (cytidine1409-2'-O)-methyltransferase
LSPRHRRLRELGRELARLHPKLENPAAAITAGLVTVDGRRVVNPRSLVHEGASIVLAGPRPLRGEAKLRVALDEFRVRVDDRVALDAGAAAGGFTRVLLERGARRVYAVDVGFGQLLGSLRADPRVVVLERVNIAQLDRSLVPDCIDLVTLDLSYLAIARAAPQLVGVAFAAAAELVALVKPQYELGAAVAPTAPAALQDAVGRAVEGLSAAGWAVDGAIESPARGSRGAVEYLVHACRGRSRTAT